MSEHKKLARLVARAFYRHSSTRDRLARVGNAKFDNSRTAEVLIDALTRRAWVKEDDLARAVLLSSKQVRKALHYLEEQRIVRRAHVKEKDKEREERTRARAEENGVEEAIIAERIRAIEKKIVTYVCLDYSRVVDAVQLRLAAAHADLKYRVEKGPVSVLYKCTSDADVCGKRYSSLDAMRLLDPSTGVQRGGGPAGRRRRRRAPGTQDQGGDESDPRQVRAADGARVKAVGQRARSDPAAVRDAQRVA